MKKLIVPMLILFGLLTGCAEVQTVKGSLCDHFFLFLGERIIDATYEGSDTQYDYYYLMKYGKYRMSKTHKESWGGPFIEEHERFPFTSWDSEKNIELTFFLSSDSNECTFIRWGDGFRRKKYSWDEDKILYSLEQGVLREIHLKSEGGVIREIHPQSETK